MRTVNFSYLFASLTILSLTLSLYSHAQTSEALTAKAEFEKIKETQYRNEMKARARAAADRASLDPKEFNKFEINEGKIYVMSTSAVCLLHRGYNYWSLLMVWKGYGAIDEDPSKDTLECVNR